jgi:multiple sugar transport system permease protein
MKKSQFFFLLIFPLLFFVVSHLIPLFYGITLSFTDSNGNFVGLQNYYTALDDYRFWGSIRFTFIYAFCTAALNLIFGLLVGTFISQIRRGQGIVKSVFLIPWAIPLAVWGLENRIIFSRDFGIINNILMTAGIITTPLAWLGEAPLAIISVVVSSVYRDMWFAALLFLVACQMIPQDFYDLALVHGATALQRFRFITLPLLGRTIITVGTLLFIFAVQAFDLPYSLTFGGPAWATYTAPLYIFIRTLHYGDFQLGTALSSIWVLIVFGLVGTTFSLLGRRTMR